MKKPSKGFLISLILIVQLSAGGLIYMYGFTKGGDHMKYSAMRYYNDRYGECKNYTLVLGKNE